MAAQTPVLTRSVAGRMSGPAGHGPAAGAIGTFAEPQAASLVQGRREGSEVRVEGVVKRFGPFVALDHVDLTIAPGEFLTLLGPSGSGKTTLLGSIAGFQAIDGGQIRVDGAPIQNTPPHRRGFGMVFQSYALFPHMSVGQNVAFPLRMMGVDRSAAERRVRETLDILKLGSFYDRLPSQLSGGQQQRVAIARAIVKRPKVVLMDEPLSALDRRLREAIQLELRDLHQTIGTTIVFVTHDQGEALALSDRIAVLDGGRIVQIGTPEELYRHPANAFVASFLGESNLLPMTVERCDGDDVALRSPDLAMTAARAGRSFAIGEGVTVTIRPERIAIVGPNAPALATAEVVGTVNLGEILRVDARLPNGGAIQVRCLDAATMPSTRLGDTIRLSWSRDDCWVLA